MTTLETLQNELNKTNNKNRRGRLRDMIKFEKSRVKGNFISKEDLVELKGLIIFITRKSLYFNTQDNLKTVMYSLLSKIENKEVVFVTKRGLKGVVTKLVKSISLELCESQLDSTINNEDFTQFRINTLM